MLEHPNKDQTFIVADIEPVDVVTMLKKYKAEIVVNYLPVGSEKATKIYAEAAIDAGCAFVNCIPSFVASDPKWAARFKAANLPVLGDDIKSQLGATFMHRTLMQVALDRGLRIVSTSQYNQGGNTDFLNMTAEHRLKHKLESKQSSIMELLDKDRKLEQKSYFGPGEFDVSYQKKGHGWRDGQKDNKTAEINLEGKMWGDTPCSYKINLSVEDSPDSAGCVADVIRCTKLALDRKLSGCIEDACYYFFKHPIRQISDAEARSRLQSFIQLSNHNL
jgi:myo-inositol-1-phosphate synthase